MADEYILKNMEVKSFNKIKLDTVEPFLEKHETKLKEIDPSVKNWLKYIKKLRNTAIKEKKKTPEKKKILKEVEPITPREKPPWFTGEDRRLDQKDDILVQLENEIVRKNKIKEWTSLEDFLSFYSENREELSQLDDISILSSRFKDMIQQYQYIWKVKFKELFSPSFSIDQTVQSISDQIEADFALKYFDKEKNYAKWIKKQSLTEIKKLIKSYGIHIKPYFIHLVDNDINLSNNELRLELEEAEEVDPTYAPDSPTYAPDSPTYAPDSPRNKPYSYEEQVKIITDFYKVVDPSKTEEECRGIVNRRRNKGSPIGTRIPTKPWLELCDKLYKKYGTDPLTINTLIETGDTPEEILRISNLNKKTVSVHRKAFVDWINNDFYQYLQRIENDSPLNIYQLLVQKYLSTETPYRGLLVYHGLGTGKTATAISLAEGLSSQMKINTMLPASLRIEFIKEIQRWGKNELNKDNKWKHYSFKTLLDENMLDSIKEKYLIDQKVISQIILQSQRALKQKIIQSLDDPDTEIEKMIDKTKSLKGVWLPDKNGESLESYEKDKDNNSLPEYQQYEKEMILQQINLLIEKKYNFIHYNPFPNFKDQNGVIYEDVDDEDNEDQFLQDDEIDKMNTHNQKKVVEFEKKLKYNIKKHNINSPFYKEVIVIDEVHNFVRAILNKRKPALIVYDWIINAVDVKLVFLSGTPVINKPSEIAILYNMLKGLIHIYHFTIQTNMDLKEIDQKLTEAFYNESSPIELFFLQKKKGKVIFSVIQETSGFESLFNKEKNVVYTIKNKDSSFNQFINVIYEKLNAIFKKEQITPSKDDYEELTEKDIRSIIRGKKRIFDTDINIVFNQKQKLFSVNENDKSLDMTDNDNFMEYFFESTLKIPNRKRILLKRMLMGLTSYYPIDRSNIVDMPTVIDPVINLPIYQSYSISNQMNIVPCMMSQVQFEKYATWWSSEKSMDLFKRLRGRNMYSADNESHHYQIRTRQTCNMVYRNEDFRGKLSDEQKEIEKKKVYDSLLMNKSLEINQDLDVLSPKMYQIMKNIDKFMKQTDEGKVPTGKILFYSDFRSDSGSEAFELILKSNGYEKFDPMNPPKTKKKRYTFITGSESNEEKRISKAYFNDENNTDKQNKYGEYLQIMIITSSGAEGISLTCVRQVHILEPYWNYVRINQVFGRAIRMKSHIDLLKEDRNVEQYIYLSILPQGDTISTVYEEIKNLKNWNVPELKSESIKNEIVKSSNKQLKELIDMIIKINNDSENKSADQLLFDIMEKKYVISNEINDIIKESSLDCIPHTRDDPYLNDKCVRFDDKLIHEISYFPGMGLQSIEQFDTIQLKSKIYHVKPDYYVVAATEKTLKKEIYIYYQLETDEKDIDIRYLRQNAKRIADINMKESILYLYSSKNHDYNSKLGKEFSVYQEMYSITDHLYDNFIQKDTFLSIDKLTNPENIHGYKLKDNVYSTYYFMPHEILEKDNSILRMCLFNEYEQNSYKHDDLIPRIIFNGKLYIQDLSQ